jgi:hypothetical protein
MKITSWTEIIQIRQPIQVRGIVWNVGLDDPIIASPTIGFKVSPSIGWQKELRPLSLTPFLSPSLTPLARGG